MDVKHELLMSKYETKSRPHEDEWKKAVKMQDKLRNEYIRQKIKIRDALTFPLRKKWMSASHVASGVTYRYSDNRWTLRSVSTGHRKMSKRSSASWMGG